MKLSDMLSAVQGRYSLTGSAEVDIVSIVADSRQVEPGAMFAAICGTSIDGHQHIDEAIARGAAAILAQTPAPANWPATKPWLQVASSRTALAELAACLYGYPANFLRLAGVTGTNGKTTTAFLVHHIMKSLWHRAGLLGTIWIDDGEKVEPAKHTTPGSIELNATLRRFVDHACRGAAMEVSSHGIHQGRVHGIAFDAAIFTNLSQDHLDYHGTMEAYAQAKFAWFFELAANPLGKKPTAIVNVDDAYGLRLAGELSGKLPVVRYGFGLNTEFRAINFSQRAGAMSFELAARGKSYLVRAPFIGRFNAYNILAALAAAHACGLRLREAIACLAEAPQVPGRMEDVGQAGGVHVYVDYAHTPDALENACRTLRELGPRRLITVFGCGGDRDKAKRPLMAQAAARHSDAVVLTSDNPRSEDPMAILAEVARGLPEGFAHLVLSERAEAIHAAVENARAQDIVLIAGKGHETYQEFADRRIDFDDRIVARSALRARAARIAEQRNQPRL